MDINVLKSQHYKNPPYVEDFIKDSAAMLLVQSKLWGKLPGIESNNYTALFLGCSDKRMCIQETKKGN